MKSWLYNIENKMRVSISVKDLKWDLQASSSKQRAEILVLAQYLRCVVLEQEGIDQSVLDKTLDFTREELIKQFEVIEHIRDQARSHLLMTIKKIHRSGDQLLYSNNKHIQNTLCALELWLCTIGAGFIPEKREDISYIWLVLTGSHCYHEQAISCMLKTQIGNLIGVPRAGKFDKLNASEWLSQCDFVPSPFDQRATDYNMSTEIEALHA